MTRRVRKLVVAAALAVVGSASPGAARQPALLPPPMMDAPAPPPPPAAAGVGAPDPGPNFLTGWPRPPEEPASLFRQVPVPTPYECAPLPGKYFETDPLLDPPTFPRPGFFASAEAQALVPHIYHDIVNLAPVRGGTAGTVAVPVSGFDWTVSPRVEIGYRLPSGFGEFLLNYQFIHSSGSGGSPLGPDGPAAVTSKFEFNLADFDYASREFTPWEHWGMKWRFGLRTLQMYYRTTLSQSPAAAAAGSGVLQEQGYNAYHGYGGHIAVELDREFNRQLPGLSLVGKLDVGNTFGFIHQSVSRYATDGSNSAGVYRFDQESPSILSQLGLNYRPAGSRIELYVGGSYGYWWNVGKNNNVALDSIGKGNAKGDLSLTGVNVRATWNY
jgi:hypothetical protein